MNTDGNTRCSPSTSLSIVTVKNEMAINWEVSRLSSVPFRQFLGLTKKTHSSMTNWWVPISIKKSSLGSQEENKNTQWDSMQHLANNNTPKWSLLCLTDKISDSLTAPELPFVVRVGGWQANWWSLSEWTGSIPLLNNIRCPYFLNLSIFCELHGKLWWAKCAQLTTTDGNYYMDKAYTCISRFRQHACIHAYNSFGL